MTMERRVSKLERTTDGLVREVTGLGVQVKSHIDQTARDREAATLDHSSRQAEILSGINTLDLGITRNAKGIADNATKLAVMEGVEDALNKLNGNAPLLSRKQRIAAYGVGGVAGGGGLALILYELWRDIIAPLFGLGS